MVSVVSSELNLIRRWPFGIKYLHFLLLLFIFEAMKLTVIIPVYNEIATLPQLLQRINAQPFDLEIIIVDDHSTDGTREYIKTLPSNTYKKLYHSRNMGKGAAVRSAQAHVKGDIVIIQDADLEYQPDDYKDLIKPIVAGHADVVYGTRFLGAHRVFYFWHYVGNKILSLITNILYNTILSDMECGYKVFKREIFKEIKIESYGFELEPELTAKVFKQGLRVVEIPITYYGRSYNDGKKISWTDFFPAIWTLIKYRFID